MLRAHAQGLHEALLEPRVEVCSMLSKKADRVQIQLASVMLQLAAFAGPNSCRSSCAHRDGSMIVKLLWTENEPSCREAATSQCCCGCRILSIA